MQADAISFLLPTLLTFSEVSVICPRNFQDQYSIEIVAHNYVLYMKLTHVIFFSVSLQKCPLGLCYRGLLCGKEASIPTSLNVLIHLFFGFPVAPRFMALEPEKCLYYGVYLLIELI